MEKEQLVVKTEYIYNYLERGHKVQGRNWNSSIYIFLNAKNEIENEKGFIWTQEYQQDLKEGYSSRNVCTKFWVVMDKWVDTKPSVYIYKRKSLLNWKKEE